METNPNKHDVFCLEKGLITHKQHLQELVYDAIAWIKWWFDYCPVAVGSIVPLQLTDIIITKGKKANDPTFSTPVAIRVAKGSGFTPQQIASEIADFIVARGADVEKVEAHKLGYVNVWLKPEAGHKVLHLIHESGRVQKCWEAFLSTPAGIEGRWKVNTNWILSAWTRGTVNSLLSTKYRKQMGW